MNLLHNNIKDNFTRVPNEVINDDRLTWKAKGLFSYLMSKPSEWQFYMSDIKNNSPDGRDSIQTGLKELEEHGYLQRVKRMDEEGKFSGWDWDVMLPDNRKNRRTENPSVGKPVSRKTRSYSKTEIIKTEINKTEGGKQVSPPPTFDQVKDYFTSKGYGLEDAKKFFEYYNEPMIDRNGRVWKDANGKTVRSWKQKALSVWMKDKPQKPTISRGTYD